MQMGIFTIAYFDEGSGLVLFVLLLITPVLMVVLFTIGRINSFADTCIFKTVSDTYGGVTILTYINVG